MELKYSFSNMLLSSAEMKKLESHVCAKTGKSLLDLMEAAGGQVAAFIEESFAAFKADKSKIVIVSGPGNNGGDGLVIGRILLSAGYNVQVVLLGSSKYSPELQNQIETYRSQSIALSILVEHETAQAGYISTMQLPALLTEAKLVVDCLLGTGQKGDPRDLVKVVCEAIISAKEKDPALKLLSVDVPTGINCDNGTLFVPHLRPDITVVIQHLKLGLVQQPALHELGDLILVDAGIESDDTENIGRYCVLTESSRILSIKARDKNAHKGDFGHVLVLAGSENMPGAAQLSALAALRGGAGLVTQLSFLPALNIKPELMYFNAGEGLNSDLVQRIVANLDLFSCIVLGPGLGKGQEVTSFVFEILREVQLRKLPCVVDADGLNAIAELLKLGVPLNLPSVIMTPHPGEAANILGITAKQVQENRFESAEKIAKLFSATVVLKGASTICFDGQIGAVNSSGGPFLATAGSGDVLSGIIAAFLASGANNFSAASLGVFLHGVAGELAFQVHNGPIISSDIIDKIPFAIGRHAAANSY